MQVRGRGREDGCALSQSRCLRSTSLSTPSHLSLPLSLHCHLLSCSAGEFAGYKEWEIVRDSCRPLYVAMHDCNHYKSRRSSREALEDKGWTVHAMDLQDAAGWAIFKRA